MQEMEENHTDPLSFNLIKGLVLKYYNDNHVLSCPHMLFYLREGLKMEFPEVKKRTVLAK